MLPFSSRLLSFFHLVLCDSCSLHAIETKLDTFAAVLDTPIIRKDRECDEHHLVNVTLVVEVIVVIAAVHGMPAAGCLCHYPS
jgi:hypothetical protein